MRALSIKEPRKLVLEEIEKPELIEGNAIVRVEKVGICGSDITAYKGSNPTMKYPIQGLGHEGVGVIVEIGENNKGLKVGDKVALEPYVPDFTCHMCQAKRFNNCMNLRVCGVHKDGMMVDYFLHPVELIYKIPEDMELSEAVLVEPLTISMHGCTRAKVSKGENVVIFGAGTIGVMAAFTCQHYGATPILVDVLDSRLEFAKNTLSISHVFNSTKGDLVEYLMDLTNGKLPEAMIECTGSPAVISNMHNYVCHGGRIALVGWPKSNVEINQIRLMQKEIDLYPSRNSCAKFPEAIDLIYGKTLPITKVITKTIALYQLEETILDMMEKPENYLKVVINMNE